MATSAYNRRIGALTVVLGAVMLCSRTIAVASCEPSDPTGYYEGTARSKEAGALRVALNLRCDAGRYDGNLVTPVGTFAIRGGSYARGALNLRFGGGAIGDEGVIVLKVDGDNAIGSFQLAADSGPLALSRTGPAHVLAAGEPDLAITKQQWHDDLHFLVAELMTKHVDPFFVTPRQKLVAEATALDARLDTLDPDQIYMGMDHVANLVGDGHTFVEFPPNLALFPLVVRRFGVDYRVVEATGAGRQALGMRVLGIGDMSVGKVYDKLFAAITPVGETEALRDARAQNFLNIGMALHGLGVIPGRSSATYKVEGDDGKTRDLTLQSLSQAEANAAEWDWVFANRPLYRQRPKEGFWYAYLSERNTVYCSFRSYTNLNVLAPMFIDFVKTKQPNKLVIDLRLNGGGDYTEGLKYLIQPITGLDSVNRKGHLFVLIGPSTFSAAMSNAAQFRTMTNALLVGQTIGERPNSPQEANEERLPNSHLLLRYSTKYYHFLPSGANMIVPDQEIEPTWQEFKAGRDPVLDWVLASP